MVNENKFWLVINVDEDHFNQAQNRCLSYKEALEKAKFLVGKYPHLSFAICEATQIVKVKAPIEIIDLLETKEPSVDF